MQVPIHDVGGGWETTVSFGEALPRKSKNINNSLLVNKNAKILNFRLIEGLVYKCGSSVYA